MLTTTNLFHNREQQYKLHFVPTLEQFCDIKARQATLATLKRAFLASANPIIQELRDDVKAWLFSNNYTGDGNGVQCYMIAFETIWNYIAIEKHSLTDIVRIDKRNKRDENGKLVEVIKERDVFSSACQDVRKYIDNNKIYNFKRKYIEDMSQNDGEGETETETETADRLILINNRYDINDYFEYIATKDLISALELSHRQKQILHLSLCDFNNVQIAEKLGVTEKTIRKHKITMGELCIKKFPDLFKSYIKKMEIKERKKA